MEVYCHPNPLLTKWIVADGLLQEPFVIIDAGCQGGEDVRWAHLGDYLDFYGFDPIPEAIEKLRRDNFGPGNRHFYPLALGNEDSRRQFTVLSDTFSSSFFVAPEAAGWSGNIATGSRQVEVRKLDTLFAEGKIPRADHIKLDCEGFEAEILIGGREYLQSSGVLSAMVETSFHVSPTFPHSHFGAVLAEMLPHRLGVADYNFERAPRAGYRQALAAQPWPEPDARLDSPLFFPGAPATHNFLFCRDFVREGEAPDHFAPENRAIPVTTDRVIKAMIGFEIHGLVDWAYVHAQAFADLLAPRLDVEKAKSLLLARPRELRYSPEVARCIKMIDELRALWCASEARAKGDQPYVPARELARELRFRILRRLGIR